MRGGPEMIQIKFNGASRVQLSIRGGERVVYLLAFQSGNCKRLRAFWMAVPSEALHLPHQKTIECSLRPFSRKQ